MFKEELLTEISMWALVFLGRKDYKQLESQITVSPNFVSFNDCYWFMATGTTCGLQNSFS